MVVPVPTFQLNAWGALLADNKKPLAQRFRALFGLRHAAESLATEIISEALFNKENSALLKHEVAYVLGQRGDSTAIPSLVKCLNDSSEEIIVRHEAAEALSALGAENVRSVLKSFLEPNCNVPAEVRETCLLAVARLDWLKSEIDVNKSEALIESGAFNSIDPAPPEISFYETEQLALRLMDPSLHLFSRYRAMFSLRNRCRQSSLAVAAVQALSKALSCPDSALLRHEVAFVLGQVAHRASFDALRDRLSDVNEVGMVRHECAEALSALAEDENADSGDVVSVQTLLRSFLCDAEPLVRESCEVALDMADHLTNHDEFQYVITPNV